MEAFRALIRGDLSPAGNPVLTKAADPVERLFDHCGYSTSWLDSGTSALALALIDCKIRANSVSDPQVIIPGYCCPDLVAAAIYAGIEPLVVDIGEDDPGYDLTQLVDAIGDRVIAIIAVNFLGVKENLDAIRRLISQRNIKLIEDNAQWFPENIRQTFSSDYVIFSFGRGKPVSLLTGGVLLTKTALTNTVQQRNISASAFKYRLKIRAYNLLLHPRAYYCLSRMPFIHLGETRFDLHQHVTPMLAAARALLAANLQAHYQRSEKIADDYQHGFAAIQNMSAINTERKGRLLRYPLLLKNQSQRDDIFGQLHSAGLGASLMYKQELNNIEGVADNITIHSPLIHAQSFSRRLLTLPVHEYVDNNRLDAIKKIIFSSLN
jgi:dTDP-4-amino-4,6-dideoxygalactose transaminase